MSLYLGFMCINICDLQCIIIHVLSTRSNIASYKHRSRGWQTICMEAERSTCAFICIAIAASASQGE